MKAFEKWWKTQKGRWSLICCPSVAEEAWKAALEWALSTEYVEDVNDCGIDVLDISTIHKELKHKWYFSNYDGSRVADEYYEYNKEELEDDE